MDKPITIRTEDIERILKACPDITHISVTGDGKHFELLVVSDVFLGLSKVKRQLWVYALLQEHILSGQLHAIHMNTWTTSEWEKQNG